MSVVSLIYISGPMVCMWTTVPFTVPKLIALELWILQMFWFLMGSVNIGSGYWGVVYVWVNTLIFDKGSVHLER